VENEIHTRLAKYRMKTDREFFDCPLEIVIENIKIVVDKYKVV
jgi:hypothetical protein